MGGYTGADGGRVRWAQLYRSGSTHLMNEDDRSALLARPIRAVVDLRSRRERADHPHILSNEALVAYHAFEHDHVAGNILRMLADPAVKAGDLRQMMVKLYADLPFRFATTLRQLLEQVAEGPLPLMFNCTAGKDRTGVAAAVLLTALGVQWDEVMSDYLMTERFVPQILDAYGSLLQGRLPGHMTAEILSPVFGVNRDYLDSARAAILGRHGSMDEYFRDGLQVDATLLQRLRDRLLD